MTNPANAQCHQRRLGADCAQSDPSSLCAQCVAKNPRFLHADSEDSDQTRRMLRQILVFAGRICNFGFLYVAMALEIAQWCRTLSTSPRTTI